MLKRLFILLIFAAIVAGAAYYYHVHFRLQKMDELVVFGNVDVREVELSFRVQGLIVDMPFEEGDRIQPGTLVGTLDKQPYLDEVRKAEANLLSVRASLNNAQVLFKRRSELITDGSISQEDLDNAQSNLLVLEHNLKSAEAQLAVANSNLQFTEVFAPTEGTILTRIREPGAVVKAADPIYTLSVSSPVWVRAFIPEPLLGIVYPGMSAEITTDTPGAPVYRGTVGFISPVAEFTPKTVETTSLRTDLVYRIRVYTEEGVKGLRQGMPVTVRLLRPEEPEQTKESEDQSAKGSE